MYGRRPRRKRNLTTSAWIRKGFQQGRDAYALIKVTKARPFINSPGQTGHYDSRKRGAVIADPEEGQSKPAKSTLRAIP
jgi:hypothetical protein